MKKKLLLSILSVSSYFLSLTVSAQTTLHTVDFEASQVGYTASGTHQTSVNSYFQRTQNTQEGATGNHDFGSAVSNFQGSSYYAGEDIDGGGTTPLLVSSDIGVTNYNNLQLKMWIAAPGTVNPGTDGYDNGADYIIVEYSYDDTNWYLVGALYGTGSQQYFAEDTNGDQIGDGTPLTGAAVEFTWSIPKLGNTLNFRIRAMSTAQNEEYMFDYIRVFGDVDNTAPTVSSITRNASTPSSASSVAYTVTFNEAITAATLDAADFDLTSATTGASVSNVTGSGTTYTVTVNTGTGSGDITLGVKTSANGSTITDLAGNAFTAGYTGDANSTYTIDKTAPTPSAPINAAQTLRGGVASTSTVASTENGNIYLILSTEAMSTQANLTAAVSASKGILLSAITAGTGYTVTPTASHIGGLYNIVAVDDLGNVSAPLTGWLTVDNTAPSVALADLDGNDDSGSSNSDNYTNVSTSLTFTGTTEANASIEIFDNTTSLATTTADGSGNWTYDLDLAAGSHAINWKATDAAGNTSAASANLNITIDQSAPTIGTPVLTSNATNDTGVSSSDQITKLSAPTITGTCTSGDVLTLISSVDGTVQTVTASSGTYSFVARKAKTGTITTTTATTGVAGVSTQFLTEFVVGQQIWNAAGTTLIGTISTINSNTSITLTANAGANLTTAAYSGGLTHNGHTVTVSATDQAGNTTTSGNLLVTIDTQAPSVSSITPVVATSRGFLNNFTGTFSGTITTATNSTNVTGVGTAFTTQLFVGAVITNSSGSAVGIVSSITNDTQLTLTANASLALSAQSYGIRLYFTVTFNEALNSNTGATNPLTTADFTKNTGTAGGTTIVAVAPVTAGGTSTSFRVSVDASGNGNWRLAKTTGTYEDVAGNSSSTAFVPAATSDATIDNTGPTLTLTQPAASSSYNHARVSYTLGESLTSGTITWTRASGSTDGNSPHAVVLAGAELTTNQTNTTLTNNPTNLVNGTTYNVAFTGADALGNTATVTNNTVLYDNSAPAAVTASLITTGTGGTVVQGYYNASNVSNAANLTVAVPIANDATLNNGTVQIFVDNQDNAGLVQLGSNSTITSVNTTKNIVFSSAELTGNARYANGKTLSFYVTLIDAAGNSTAGAVSTPTLKIDTQVPTITNVTLNLNTNQRETAVITFSENLLLANNDEPITTTTLGNQGFYSTQPSIRTGGGSLTKADGANHITLQSSGDGNWTSSVQFTYTASGSTNTSLLYVRDAAGNELGTTTVGVSLAAPTLASSMVLNPNGSGIFETITFTVDQDLNIADGGNVTGLTVDGNAVTATYASATRAITITSAADGAFTGTSLVSYAPGNIQGTTNVAMAGFTNESILLTPVSIASNNTNTSYATTGNTVTVSFTSTKVLSGTPTVTIGGATATVTGTNPYSASVSVASITSGQGTVPFIITATETSRTTTVSITLNGSSVTLDNVSPTVVVSHDQSDDIVKDSDADMTITATFTETNSIDEVTPPTITIAGVVTNAAMSKSTNKIWTYTWSVPAGNDGSHAITITAKDLAGNTAAAPTGVTALLIDNTAPSVALSDNSTLNVVRDANTVTITATFTETNNINETTPPTISIGGLVTNGAMSKTSNKIWTYSWNVPSGNDGTVNLSISATDEAGNASTAATGETSFLIDNIAPDVDLADSETDNIVRDANTVVITATFDDTNNILESTKPKITIGTIVTNVDMTKTSNKIWTYSWDVPAGNDGTVNVTITATDEAGNANTAATGTTQYIIDNDGPDVNITDNQADNVVRGTDSNVVITASFTETNGIDESIPPTITIGTLVTNAAMTKNSNLEWEYTWDPPAAVNQTANVTITAYDIAGNAVSSSTGRTSYIVDNTAPTIVLSDSESNNIVRDADAVLITATFTEANQINETTPPTITIGTLVTNGAMTKSSNLVWTYTWNVPAGNDGTVSVSVSATDVAGNTNTAATGRTSWLIDNDIPSVVLSDNQTDNIVRDANTVLITATFGDNNNINETTPPTITIGSVVTNAAMTKTSNKIWTYSWNVPAGNDGTANVSITATDEAGNSNSAATGRTSYLIDNSGPAVVLSDNHVDNIVRDADNVTITADFTDTNSINETTPPTISIGGIISNAAMTKSTNKKWTYTWNVPAGNDGTVNVTITATDDAGNSNTVATGKNSYIIDNTAPTVVLSDFETDNIVRDADNAIVITATFTESNQISETVVPRISIGGIVSNVSMTKTSNLVWTYTWNVPAAVNGNVAVAISATDVAGNANTAATGRTTWLIDNTSPTIVLSHNQTDNIVRDADNVLITATFTETNNINETTPPTISIGGLVTNAVMTKSTNKIWTYSWNVPSGNDGNVAVSVSATDDAGNANTAATGVTSYIIDNTSPTVVVSTDDADNIVRDANTVLITATFTDTNNIYETTAPRISIGTLVTNVTMTKTSNKIWTYSWNVPAGNDGTVGVTITATDEAGNANSAATGVTSFLIDNVAPIIESIKVNPTYTNVKSFGTNGTTDSDIEWTLTFSEDVINIQRYNNFYVGSDYYGGTSYPFISVFDYQVATSTTNDTVNFTAQGVTGTGTLHLYFYEYDDITDVAGNPLGGPGYNNGDLYSAYDFTAIIGDSYTKVLPEPTLPVTAFSASSIGATSITAQWTHPGGSQAATHYLVMAKESTVGSFTPSAIQDGSYVNNDANAQDNGIMIMNIDKGAGATQSQQFTGLRSGVTYDFIIYPYTLSPHNPSNSNIDFNTISDTFTATTTTGDNTTITLVSATATISSLVDDNPATGQNVYSFAINEDGATVASKTIDNAPFKFSKLIIKKGDNNTINDWSQAIAGVELYRGTTLFTGGTVSIHKDSLKFDVIPTDNTTDFGYIADDANITFTLKIWLKTDLSGTEDYPKTIDGKKFEFKVDHTSFTYDNTPQSSSTVTSLTGGTSESGDANNVVTVVATRLDFTSNPTTPIGVDKTLPDQPEVRARDVNGNTDLGYHNMPLTVSTDNGLELINPPTTTNLGVLTFSGFAYGDDGNGASGNGTLKVYDGSTFGQIGTLTDATSIPVDVSYTTTSTISGGTLNNVTISSIADTEAEKIDVLDFYIEDDAGTPTVDDGTSTHIKTFIFIPSISNDNVNLNDWREVIGGAILTDDDNHESTVSDLTINADNLTISVDPDVLGRIADDATKKYTLSIWLRSDIIEADSLLSEVIDQTTLGFEILAANTYLEGPTEADSESSRLTSSNDVSGSNLIEVEATEIHFVQQWVDGVDQNYDAALTPTPIAKARDVNRNKDSGFTASATVETTSTTTYPLENDNVLNTNGTFTFENTTPSTSLRVSSSGNGVDGAITSLTLTAGALEGVSNTFRLRFSVESDITNLSTDGFAYPTNIDYASHQETSLTNTTGVAMEQYTVRDGGSDLSDPDGSDTELNSITIRVTNYAKLRRLAIFEQSGSRISQLDITTPSAAIVPVAGDPTTADITFSNNLTTFDNAFVVNDNSSLRLIVRASFIGSGMVDNTRITFNVQSISAAGVSSQFTATATSTAVDASNALTFENQVEVSATKVYFYTNPDANNISTYTNVNNPYIVLRAYDGNNNHDVDYTGAINTGAITATKVSPAISLSMQNKPAGNFIAGVYNFQTQAPTFQFTSDSNDETVELSISAAGLSAGLSTPFKVSASDESYISLTEAASATIPFINYQADILNNPTLNNNDDGFVVAKFTLHDGGADNSALDVNGDPIDDADGASTVLKKLVLSLTNSADIKAIALYDGSARITPQVAGSATIEWDNINVSTADNTSKELTLRATFHDTISVDNAVIHVTITAVENGGGSKFAHPTTGGGFDNSGGATTGATNNKLAVVATKFHFTASPNGFEGINLDINPPRAEARDIFNNLDLDFNSNTFTLETIDDGLSGAPVASLGNAPTSFVQGVLEFHDMVYTSVGPGTLRLSEPSLADASTSHVDVTHIYATEITNGILQTNLGSGLQKKVIFGLTFHSDYSVLNSPKLQGFNIDFITDNLTIGELFSTYKIYESKDNSYRAAEDTDITNIPGENGGEAPTVTASGKTLIIDFKSAPRDFTQATDGEISYFLVVDVDKTVNPGTPVIKPTFKDDDYSVAAGDNATASTGSSYTELIEGREYNFTESPAPVVLSSFPASGQIDLDITQTTLELVFSTPVWTLDKQIYLYDYETNELVDTLVALNGYPYGVLDSLAGTEAKPLKFTLPQLEVDHMYYVTIAKGSKEDGIGIVDQVDTECEGFSYPGTLYFKTFNPNAPILLTDPQPAEYSNPTTTGVVISGTFDQTGKAYYMVVNNGDPKPSVSQIIGGPGYSGTIAGRGSFDIIKTTTISQYGILNAPLNVGSTYNVWMYAQSYKRSKSGGVIQVDSITNAGPYGNRAELHVVDGNNPTLTFTVPNQNDTIYANNPIIKICANSYQTINEPIIIHEGEVDDLTSTTGVQAFNLLLPSGYEFDTGHGKVTLVGNDFDQTSDSLQFINNSILKVRYRTTSETSLDKIILSDLKIYASESARQGYVIRLGGNGLPGIADDEVLATLQVGEADEVFFTNSYNDSITVTYIPRDFVDPERGAQKLRLIPVTEEGDYGPSSFSGPNVLIDELSLGAFADNTAFNITVTHTDNNGCVATKSVQYSVYDPNTAITGLKTKYCIACPNFPEPEELLTAANTHTIVYSNNLTGHVPPSHMYDFYVDIPDYEEDALSDASARPLIHPDSAKWVALVRTLIDTIDSADPLYNDYRFDFSKIINAYEQTEGHELGQITDPYEASKKETDNLKHVFYEGGYIGKLRFTGWFRHKTNTDIIFPKQQTVEVYLPAKPVIEIDEDNRSYLDTEDPNNDFADYTHPDDPRSTNKGTLIFCEAGGSIDFTGYPRAEGGKIGSFELSVVDGSGITVLDDTLFTDNGNGTGSIDPTLIRDAGHSNKTIKITYTYKEGNAVCESQAYRFIKVVPNPVASINPINIACVNNQITFKATTSFIPQNIRTFYWTFGDAANSDSNNPNTDSLAREEASHIYELAATYKPELKVRSKFNCLSEAATTDVKVGQIDTLDFAFLGVSTNKPIVFEADNGTTIRSRTSTNDAFDSLIYYFNNDGKHDDLNQILTDSVNLETQDASHQYDSASTYLVKLWARTELGCFGEVEKRIVVVPAYPVTPAKPFEETFEPKIENNKKIDIGGGWQPYRLNENDSSSWTFGKIHVDSSEEGRQNGKVVMKIDENLNGSRVWVTDTAKAYRGFERSALYSPAFDLSALERPMISFDRFVNVGEGDGVVLQYSTDSLNISDKNKVWKTLGLIDDQNNSTGVHWYDKLGLPSSPGGQQSGDYGWSSDSDTTWRQSKHNLDELTGASRVIFRFAMGSVSKNPDADGFALDNVRIGERTRVVLVENFTNLGNAMTDPTYTGPFSGWTVERFENNFINNFNATGTGSQIVKLNYHTAFPAMDPLNVDNPQDPSARALYYHVSSTPRAMLDGANPMFNAATDAAKRFSSWGESTYGAQSLKLANASIDIGEPSYEARESGEVIHFDVKVKAQLIDLPPNTILHVAIIEEEVAFADLNETKQAMVRTGETSSAYVMKKMLPTAAGTRLDIELDKGDSLLFEEFKWAISDNALYGQDNDFFIIAFLQNEETKEIYQTEIRPFNDPEPVTGIEQPTEKLFKVYPVPADDEVTVELPEPVRESTTITLYDQLGKVAYESVFNKGEQKKKINTRDASAGVYLIQVNTSQGPLRRRVLIVHKQ